MRAITKKSIESFFNGENKNFGNTKTEKVFNSSYLYLHDNLIGIYDHDTKVLKISNCGWFTNTTKERLNGLPNVNICQRNYKWYLNGKEWNGEMIEVK